MDRRTSPTRRTHVAAAIAVSLLAGAGLAAGCGATRTPGAVVVVEIDTTASESAAQRAAEEHALSANVLPYAETHHARVVVGLITAASDTTDARIVADETFIASSDNPDVKHKTRAAIANALTAQVDNAVTGAPPAAATDIVGALVWSAQILQQAHVGDPGADLVVLLSDGLATTPGCNLTAEPLATAAQRNLAVAGCLPADPPRFPTGTSLWESGAAVDPDITAAQALNLEAFYQNLAGRLGLHLTAWGPQLLPPTSPAA